MVAAASIVLQYIFFLANNRQVLPSKNKLKQSYLVVSACNMMTDMEYSIISVCFGFEYAVSTDCIRAFCVRNRLQVPGAYYVHVAEGSKKKRAR